MADHQLTGGPEAMLEQCRHCPSQMAHPLRWRRLALDAWEIELRCPDCRQVWYERVPTAAVKRLDRVLKQARIELEKHLEEIDRIDFQEQAEDFIAALHRDKILPEDFLPPSSP